AGQATTAIRPGGIPFPSPATVTANKPLTGGVIFYDFGNEIVTMGLSGGQAQIGWGYLTALGVHQITASYSGDSANQPSSTAAPLTQVITGTTNVTMVGATGGDLHYLPVTIGVQ